MPYSIPRRTQVNFQTLGGGVVQHESGGCIADGIAFGTRHPREEHTFLGASNIQHSSGVGCMATDYGLAIAGEVICPACKKHKGRYKPTQGVRQKKIPISKYTSAIDIFHS